MNIWEMGAVELLEAYKAGTISPKEAMQATLSRVSTCNPALNAIFSLREEEALLAAADSERRWRSKTPIGPLDGVPITIKDSVAMKGWPYLRGAKAREGMVSDADSPPAARLKEAGAIVFGKTTMPDFGMLPSGVSSMHGVTRNPWNLAFNTGGSSSGAAASVAAGMGAIAIGTDLAGSVRLPAAHCGVFALKPSNGVVPHLPASNTRVAGPMTRNVEDAALAMSVLCRPDARSTEPGGHISPKIRDVNVKGMKIGLLLDINYGHALDSEVEAAILRSAEIFKDGGAQLSVVAIGFEAQLLEDLRKIFAVAAALDRDTLPLDRRALTLDHITRFCDGGDAVSGKELQRAINNVESAKARFTSALGGFDFVISPVLPIVGYPADALGADPGDPYSHINFTAMVNHVGWPASAICCGFSRNDLPIGLQIIGAFGRDEDVLAVSAWFERNRGFKPGFPGIVR